MPKNNRYKIIGAIAGIALLLMLAVTLNPGLFQGFILQQVSSPNIATINTEQGELAVNESKPVSIVVTNNNDQSCANLVSQMIEQVKAGEDIYVSGFVGAIRRINRCSCQYVNQLFSALEYTEEQMRQALIDADLGSEFNCPLPTNQPNPDDQPPATTPGQNPEGASISTPGLQTTIPENTEVPPNNCAQQKVASLQNLRSEIGNPYSEIENLKTAGCECPDIHEVIRQLGFSSDEAVNQYLENADQVECVIPTTPLPIPTCADYKAMAEASINAYRETGSHTDLADTLDYMLKIDTGCCDFCSASGSSSTNTNTGTRVPTGGSYQLLVPPSN